MNNIYKLLNIFFHALHIAIILGSVFLCFNQGTRVLHLVLQFSILFSWLVVGPILKKPGLCIITDIQRKINAKLGRSFPSSYMVYLYEKFGLTINNETKTKLVSFGVLTICTGISIFYLL